jgi:calcineurin-like phosphoesterase family protein
MAHDSWVTSDQHFGHAKILTFTGLDDQLIRPGFSCVEEMDEVMIERWNARVKPLDKVYHLGDLGFGNDKARMDAVMGRLNGRKRFIPGNHDAFEMEQYLKHFDRVYGCRVGHDLPGNKPFVMTHVPWHPMNMGWGHKWCVHGHIHEKVVKREVNGVVEIDTRYINVCVEHTDYYPVAWDDLLARMV